MQAAGPRDDDPGAITHGGTQSSGERNDAVDGFFAAVVAHREGRVDKGALTAAISRWRRETQQAEPRPEHVLVEFKKLLERVPPGGRRQSIDDRMAEQRQLILLCIEEYYSERSP
jgi:hypothetical protein